MNRTRLLWMIVLLHLAVLVLPASAAASVASFPGVKAQEYWIDQPTGSIDQAYYVESLHNDGAFTTVSVGLGTTDEVIAVWLYAGERLRAGISGWPGTNHHLYVYAPDATDFSAPISSATSVGVESQNLEFSASETGWYFLRGHANGEGSEAAFGLQLLRSATVVKMAPAATTLSQGGTTTLNGTVKLAEPYEGSPVVNEGNVLVSLATNGSDLVSYKVVPVVNGAFSVKTPPWIEHKTTYQAVYMGTDSYASSASIATAVSMKAYLSAVSASRYGTRAYRLSGILAPLHASSSYPVRIYLWRYVNGTYKAYGYKNAKAYTVYDEYGYPATQYKLSYTFPYAGKWRLRAYHSDSAHAPVYSSYSYVTAR